MSGRERAVRRVWWFVGTALALGTSYGISPLFSSNQNHHFLIGLARAGDGWLASDWLTQTADPFPVFSELVEVVHRTVGDRAHYVLYYALFGVYGCGLMRVTESVWPAKAETRTPERIVFVAALCLIHNEAIGYLLGIDLRHISWWQMTHWGVAEQEIFGHGAFQASSFGMLLPFAVALFLDGQPLWAAALVGAVAAIHFSYAWVGLTLVTAFALVHYRRTGSAWWALSTALPALFLAGPVAIDVYRRMGPSSEASALQAAAILVRHLPQEASVSEWFTVRTVVQVGVMLSSLLLTAGTDLFVILLVPFVAGVLGTLVQVVVGSPRLALLFPWRVSVLLVPMASALLLRRMVVVVAESRDRRRLHGWARVAVVALVASIVIGGLRMMLQAAYFSGESRITRLSDRVVPPRWRADFQRVLGSDALPMMRAVRRAARAGDLYLTPPELERFRLETGVAVLADRKSHPYKDVEVVEWRRRLDFVEGVYAANDPCTAVKSLRRTFPITHIVADKRIRELDCPAWTPIYADRAFVVYQFTAIADVE